MPSIGLLSSSVVFPLRPTENLSLPTNTIEAAFFLVQKEKIALTALFCASLGLLPAWSSFLLAIAGVARLAFCWLSLYSENSRLEQESIQLRIQNRELQHLSQGAIQDRTHSVRESKVLCFEKRVLQIALEKSDREKEHSLGKVQSLERAMVSKQSIEGCREKQIEAMRIQIASLQQTTGSLEEINRELAQKVETISEERNQANREKQGLQPIVDQRKGQKSAFEFELLAKETERNALLQQIEQLLEVPSQEGRQFSLLDQEIQTLVELQRKRGAEGTKLVTESFSSFPIESPLIGQLASFLMSLHAETQSLEKIAKVFTLHRAFVQGGGI